MDTTSSDGRAERGENPQKPLERDPRMLVDMLETSTIWSLTRAFADTNRIAIGVFTPDGQRLGGEPVHHCEYCQYIYSSPQGYDGCRRCDLDRIPDADEISRPYRCHANLLDFVVPIVAHRKDRPVLIGAMFAGQLRPTSRMSGRDVKRLRTIADKYGLDFDTLLAKYVERPYFVKRHVKDIQGFMKALAVTIGQMVTRRYEQHSLMQQLSRMDSPEDVTVAIARFMDADACSMFTQNLGEKGRIYLRATSFEPLHPQIGRAFYEAGDGLTGWVYEKNRTLNLPKVDDAEALCAVDPKLHWSSKVLDVPKKKIIRSFIAVPIRDDQRRCVGVIRAVRVNGEVFSPMQQETFEAVADIARQIVELMRRQEEREIILSVADGVLAQTPLQDVIESAISQAMRLFEHCADNVWLTRYLPTETQFEIAACYQPSGHLQVGQRFPEDQGIAGWMLKHRGEMLFSNNLSEDNIVSFVRSVKACIVYPIMFGDEFFGIIAVASSKTGVFSDNDREQLQLLGFQVTQAFENARLFEQTQKEQATLNKYFQCLNNIANLPPPWEPKSVTRRVCEEFQRLGFTAIRAEVRDKVAEKAIAWTWKKTPGQDGYQEVESFSISGENMVVLQLGDVASNGSAIATVEVSPREDENSFTEVDRMCLGLAERLAAGRLRDEAELASTVTSSIGASTHGLRTRVANVRDRIDGLLDDPRAQSVRIALVTCEEQLQSAVEWCETSELFTQYRRGNYPPQSEFSDIRLLEYLPPFLETCQELPDWTIDTDDIPPETRVQAYAPGLRRIISDLVRNAEEHGIRTEPRKVTLTLLKQPRGDRIRIAVSNFSDHFTPQMAADLREKARTPERMTFDPELGIGTMLAAVIAKIHDDCLGIEAEDGLVTFSFTLAVCASPSGAMEQTRRIARSGSGSV